MGIQYFKPYTPSRRHTIIDDFSEITKTTPEKKLLSSNKARKGRNNRGVITTRHKGGGHKKRYRIIDFKRKIYNVEAKVNSIQYDPNRNVRIALLFYKNGQKSYILQPQKLTVGSRVESGPNVPLKVGNALPLKQIPLGYDVHNIELYPLKGGQFVRAAGTFAKILAKEGNFVTIKLPSKEVRMFSKECYATIGQLSNLTNKNIKIGKAGRNRWLGIRPTVRGVVMNPCDHPHGGGEGRSPIGKSHPSTPWGKPALGFKTRKKKKSTTNFIIRRRN